RTARGLRCLRRCDQHYCDSAGCCGPGRGQCTQVQSLGHVHHRHDHSYCAVDGHLSEVSAARQGFRNLGDRFCAGDGGGGGRTMGLSHAQPCPRLHLERLLAFRSHYHLRLRRLRCTCLAAADAARLPEHLCEAGCNPHSCHWYYCHSAHAAHALAHSLHRWKRSCVRRNDLPVCVHHHCLWSHQRLSFSDLQRHHSEDDCARDGNPHGRLRSHDGRIVCRGHGHDRRLHYDARPIFRHQ